MKPEVLENKYSQVILRIIVHFLFQHTTKKEQNKNILDIFNNFLARYKML
jgi:hypothetical protein